MNKGAVMTKVSLAVVLVAIFLIAIILNVAVAEVVNIKSIFGAAIMCVAAHFVMSGRKNKRRVL